MTCADVIFGTHTVAALMDSQEPVIQIGRDAAKKRLAEAEAKLTRFQNAIIAGVDPAALVEAINEAQAERLASRAALDNVPAPVEVDVAEIYAAIDSIGDVSAALRGSAPTRLEELYEAIDLQGRYKQNPHEADVSINPVGVNNAGVRGPSRPLRPRTPPAVLVEPRCLNSAEARAAP